MEHSPTQTKKLVHKAYVATIITNSCIAVGDTALAIVFLCKDFVIATLATLPALHVLSTPVTVVLEHTAGIGAFYFFSHGIVKLFLLWGLLRKKLWAYPTAMLFLTGFNLYQLALLYSNFSWFVTGLLLFNTMTVLLIAAEYREVQAFVSITPKV